MDDRFEKIVEFHSWCKRCKHFDKDENDDPCNECLNNGGNVESRRPVMFEEEKS